MATSPAATQPATPCPTGNGFFPGTAIEDRAGWYGKHLVALGERPLCQGNERAEEVYRLTWLPSFHPSIVVRVECDSACYRLVAKRESGAGGYDPGHLDTTRVIELDDASRRELARLLAAADFWRMPTVPPPDSVVGLDGAQWILEGRTGGRYHVVDRWSPDRNGPDAHYRALAEWLLARSGLASARLVKEY